MRQLKSWSNQNGLVLGAPPPPHIKPFLQGGRKPVWVRAFRNPRFLAAGLTEESSDPEPWKLAPCPYQPKKIPEESGILRFREETLQRPGPHID